jgi:HK97 family phage prohead protease
MIIRTKNGNYSADTTSVLLDYLGIKKKSAGVQKIPDDVELIACIPFRLTADVEAGHGFPWTLSTFDLDRYGERIDPLGWDFKRFMDNPVVEWSHRYDIPAIGKIERLMIDNEGLHGVVYFNDKSFDPFAWSIEQRIKAGSIRAGSVGFRVIEIEIPAASDSKDGTSLIFRKQELLEFSICNVPANPWALARKEHRTEGSRTDNREQSKEECNYSTHFLSCLINNLQE